MTRKKATREEPEIFLDVETLRLSHEVAGGWSNIRGFGLALAVTWDEQHSFRAWFETDAAGLLAELAAFAQVVTFNGDRFDLEVLSAYGATQILREKSFDVLADLHRRLGFRVKLDDLAQATLGSKKSGSGLDAVQWWREGNVEKVRKYCEMDVQILREIVAHGRQHGYVVVDRRQVQVEWS
jgi:DEAD/DEAH box helicase domain-containing protein